MEPVRWRKIGGGSFRMADGKRIKPNQVFMAAEEDIPQGFRSMVVRLEAAPPPLARAQKQLKLEAVPIPEPEASAEVEQALENAQGNPYKMAPRGIGWWNVVNTNTGKVLNEKALRHTDAMKLIESLV